MYSFFKVFYWGWGKCDLCNVRVHFKQKIKNGKTNATLSVENVYFFYLENQH